MKKLLLLAGAAAVSLAVGFESAAGATGEVTCVDAVFKGTATNVIVPRGRSCRLVGATVTQSVMLENDSFAFADGATVGNDVVAREGTEFDAIGGTTIGDDLLSGSNASIHLEETTVSGDLRAFQPATVQTGHVAPGTPGGPVDVDHDVVIQGSPPDNDFVFDGVCSVTVGHDFRMLDRAVTLGFGIGDNCLANGERANSVGHDLIVSGNSALVGFFGPSALEVGGNQVGHDLVVTDNSAEPGGYLEVADNVVGHDAICQSNDPAPSKDPFDGPNIVRHENTCG